MRRTLVIFVLSVLALYVGTMLALGSSPVQKRVLAEIQKVLSTYGLVLKIESIEFSALSPRIYLNRVSISALPGSDIPLAEPLAIDKIKIQFQPLALIYRRILIEEATLFHPRIIVPNAEKLVKRVEKILKSQKRVEVSSGSFSVVVEKFGVVDALFNIVSKDPPLAARSRSLSAFLQRNSTGQQTITIESPNLEIERGKLRINLTKTDIDVDLAPKSLRVNRAIIEGDNKLAINIRGTASLPFKEGMVDAFSAVYDVSVPLPILNQIAELKLEDEISGVVQSAGTLRKDGASIAGNGNVHYDNVIFDDFKFGVGSLHYKITDQKLSILDLSVRYGGGDVRSSVVTIDLKDHFPINGELTIKDLKLNGLLDHLDQPNIPLRMLSSGTVKIGGQLKGPFNLIGNVKLKTKNFAVVDDDTKDETPDNIILGFADGEVQGTMTFSEEKLSFIADVNALGGSLESEGQVGYNSVAKIKVRGEGLSLTQLHHIAVLRLGGTANIFSEIDVQGKDVKVAGAFDVANAEVQGLVIGPVKGQAFFQNALLTFENLETAAIEPVRGNGFVDFKPKDVHFRFDVGVKRANIDQVFGIFQKDPLSIPTPSGGELNGRITIEGGHDDDGVSVMASGQAKNFEFYDENWLSANYDIHYRPAAIELTRMMLFKKSGGVEASGKFEPKTNKNKLTLKSQGLRLEELDHVGKAPLTGEVVGDITLLGDFSVMPPQASGDIRLVKATFRGNPVPDSGIRARAEGRNTEFVANVAGEKLRGRFVKHVDDKTKSELLLYLRDFDFAWLITLGLGRDIPTLSEIAGTGDISLKGDFSSWQSLKGNGSVTDLVLGLKGAPMKNKQPLSVVVDGGFVKINRFNLVGAESQISLDLLYQPGKMIQSSIDGKMDLQFIQPFIPGLDYGTGKVSVGIRVSGNPEKFDMLGNATLEDGVFRLTGMTDEFRAVQAQLGVSQDRVNVDRFDAVMNGGTIVMEGDVGIRRFKSLIPNLQIQVNRVTMKTQNYLSTTMTGDLFLKGTEAPYLLGGKCRLLQAKLTSFGPGTTKPVDDDETPPLRFDITCEAKDKAFVVTDVMDAEFKGTFQLLGTTSKVGLLGNAESIRGNLLFKDTKFSLTNGSVKFESPEGIAPRFNVSGTTRKKDVSLAQDFDVNLQVFGTPTDYKIRLTSSPPLPEGDIIALLLIGITGKTADSSYVGLATALAGQSPIQSKLQSQFGFDVRINQTNADGSTNQIPVTTSSGTNAVAQVPTIQIQKEITKKTKLSYSNSLDFGSTSPIREFKIEHALDDNFTINGTALDRARGSTATQSNQAYGLDFRYRFSFE